MISEKQTTIDQPSGQQGVWQTDPSDHDILMEKTGLSARVSELLETPFEEQLSPKEQGNIIVDQFVGMLHRASETEADGEEPMSVEEVIATIHESLTAAVNHGAVALKGMTRNNGLRFAVEKLLQDERTSSGIQSIRSRFESVEGEPVLKTYQQIVGYLHGDDFSKNVMQPPDDKNLGPDSKWVDGYLERIRLDIEGGVEWTNDPDMHTSENDSVKDAGYQLRKLLETAKQVGIDGELIKRSVDRLVRQHKVGLEIGSTAAHGAVQTAWTDRDRTNRYDRLFNPED